MSLTSTQKRYPSHAGVALCVVIIASLAVRTSTAMAEPKNAAHAEREGCGYQTPEEVRAAIRTAVEAGQIHDPALRVLPKVAQRPAAPAGPRGGSEPTVMPADIFPYEDTAGVLLTNFTNGQLFDLMAAASNSLLAAHGDNFDFIGFFLNFAPNHTIGSAFYLGLENDTTGLGQGLFNDRPALGVAGVNLQGWVMMWNQASWGPTDTTMLVLGQEFEHRWALFLNPLLDGRSLQGTSGCGRSAHWNWKADGQGSGMEIREWVGSNPAVLGGDCAPGGFFFICFNSDIGDSPGGLGAVWSYPDLYLMGYVSPAEMDAGTSELRYMETSNCSSNYSGTISTFGSADIIATNGTRIPDSNDSQKDFRTGWIMLHQPGAPPTAGQLDNVVNILNRWSETWQWSSLNRGTVDNTLLLSFSISFPNGTPEILVPDQTTTLNVQTTNITGAPDTSSGLLHYAIDGGSESTAPLSFLGGNSFQGTIPAIACGSTIEYFVTIDAIGGGTIRGPAAAVFAVSYQSVFFNDDFETDAGWTISGDAVDGQWSRGIPVGGGDRGDPPTDYDGSGQCWLTDNVDGNTDVDTGTTILTSPVMDISSVGDPYVSYARWYSNATGAAPQEDVFVVEVSSNGGGAWTNLETVGPTISDPNSEVSGGWYVKLYRVADFVLVTNQFRIRFSASDLGAGSLIEAGVDALSILECAVPCPIHDGDFDGNLVTDGLDLKGFTDEIVAPSGDPDLVCAGDFNDSGAVDLGDVDGMVDLLLAP